MADPEPVQPDPREREKKNPAQQKPKEGEKRNFAKQSIMADSEPIQPETRKREKRTFTKQHNIANQEPEPAQSTTTESEMPDSEEASGPSQGQLEEYYLPHPAKTSNLTDNAKVSLLLEILVRYVHRENRLGLRRTDELVMAVEKGIRAREVKGKPDGRKKRGGGGRMETGGGGGGGGEMMAMEEAGRWLRGSAERLRLFVAGLV